MAERTRTRRDYLVGTGALVGGGLLAGCSGGTDGESTSTTASTTTGTGETSTTSEASDGGPHAVSMAPVGDVTFESVPETWVASNGSWADMAIALGRDAPAALVTPNRYHTEVYEEFDGIDVNADDVTMLWPSGGLDKELFYSVGADVHVIDPNFITSRSEWTRSDIRQIADDVGPFFGNTGFTHAYGWHDGYRYYSLYEEFETLAAVFQQRERYEAFASLHESFLDDVQSRLPAESERPSIGILMTTSAEPTTFYPYPMNDGTAYKQYRDLGASSALTAAGIADFSQSGSTIDYEALLDADPDKLFLWGGTGQFERMSRDEFEDSVLAFMTDHETASELTAVQNGDVYRGGGLYQGPIINLVWTERAAWQLYPDEFDRDAELFDRARVESIVSGAF
ncbi:ABC transporter substrate-binding protein [Halarchaeum acidiphilum]|uniref:ABC transporter substrate-binding protein n=1 Tax=Halarchaeum acidiphilum TaxID=489138 RepID=UPI0003720D6C|nr:ABC transporter substrate-binding protein [Halarchaeum acidiphilum]